MDINTHIHLRSFSKPSEVPIIKAIGFAVVIHLLFIILWQSSEKITVAEMPQWINIKLSVAIEEQKNKEPSATIHKIKSKPKKNKPVSKEQKNVKKRTIEKELTPAKATTFIKADSRPYSIKNPKPVYPAAARRRGMQGVVLLSVEINREGYVNKVDVVKTSGFRVLDRSARNSVQSWRFIPAKNGDEYVSSKMEIPIRFILKNI